MIERKKIGILLGGQSGEHQVSLLSAKNIIDAINKEKYELLLIGISRSGRWRELDSADYLFNANDPNKIELTFATHNGPIFAEGLLNKLAKLDVIFPVLHGPNGEDGTVQGLLQLLNVPFVGSKVLGSAMCMDKDVTKRLLRAVGLPTVKWAALSSPTGLAYNDAVEELGEVLFVKPANLGSSVGVSKVTNEESYKNALDLAFRYDRKVLVEQGITPMREIECSVLGNAEPFASLPGETVVHADFYSYAAKYLDINGATPQIPADLRPDQTKEIQNLAVCAFSALNCAGLARVDFFLRGEEILVNEINTMPGFTNISMYPKMWEKSGISYGELIDKLIDLGLSNCA